MKTNFLLLLAGSVLLAGCGESTKQSDTSAAVSNVVNAPTEYLGTVLKAKQTAEKSIDTSAINNALNMFNQMEGRYPTDLNELVTKKYLRVLPPAPYGHKIIYDATKGEVKVVKQ